MFFVYFAIFRTTTGCLLAITLALETFKFNLMQMKEMKNNVSQETRQRIKAAIDALDLRCRRHIDLVVIHCSATPAGRDVTAAEIRRWHTSERGFADIGYHFVVRIDGTVEPGRPLDKAGAHCRGHNTHSIGVCYVGGADSSLKSADTRTPAQHVALDSLLGRLREAFPGVEVKKHRELARTLCPGF